MTEKPPEDGHDRLERLRREAMRDELWRHQMRPLPPPQDERSRGGHAAKAGLRGTTLLLVVVAVLASLWVLEQASKRLDLREDPKRPGVGRAR